VLAFWEVTFKGVGFYFNSAMTGTRRLSTPLCCNARSPSTHKPGKVRSKKDPPHQLQGKDLRYEKTGDKICHKQTIVGLTQKNQQKGEGWGEDMFCKLHFLVLGGTKRNFSF